jgi:hypothetical protein
VLLPLSLYLSLARDALAGRGLRMPREAGRVRRGDRGLRGGDWEERSARASHALALLEPDRRALRLRLDERRRPRQGEFELLGARLHSMDVPEAVAWLVRSAASRRRDALPVVHANAHNLQLLLQEKQPGGT